MRHSISGCKPTLKLQLSPGSEVPALGNQIVAPTARRQRRITTYYDTADGLLYAAGVALCIRQRKGGFLQTVKLRCNDRGLASRKRKWRWRVSSNAPDTTKLAAAKELADLAKQITARVHPVYVTDLWRSKHRIILPDGTLVTLILQTGAILCSDKSAPIAELKLALKAGSMSSLYDFAMQLSHIAPMRISGESKFARGLAMVHGYANQTTRWRNLPIDGHVSGAAALAQIINALLCHAAQNIAPTLADDAEALRQLRWALRQTRGLLRLFDPLLAPTKLDHFDAALRDLAQMLGSARDLDVMHLVTLPAAIAAMPLINWKPLIDLCDAARRTTKAMAFRAIRGPALTYIMLELARWADTCAASPLDVGTKRLTKRVSKIAPALLQKAARKARRAGRHPMRLSMQELHDFRKALDRLTAATRFLGGNYSGAAGYRRRIDDLRELIGRANDANATKGLVQAFAHGDMSDCIEALIAWADRDQALAMAGLAQATAKFRASKAFWQA